MPRRKFFSSVLHSEFFSPSATSEFLCVLCVEILILTFSLSLLRASVVDVLVAALPRCANLWPISSGLYPDHLMFFASCADRGLDLVQNAFSVLQ